MASEVYLTDGVIRATPTFTVQLPVDALDVGRYDQLDLMLIIHGFEGTGGNVTINIQSGMSRESNEGWPTLGSWINPAINSPAPLNVKGLYRYIRWTLSAYPGGMTAVSFSIRGMARQN